MSLIPNFPKEFNDEHHAWHTAGEHSQFPTRTVPMGQPGSGIEFLQFHRNFMAKVLNWYRQQPAADMNAVAPWTAIPAELKDPQLRWNAQEAADEQRIMTLRPPFASEDALGIFIETGIHNRFLHGATAQHFNEPMVKTLHSPGSTFFYKIHGLVQNWWVHWLDQFDLHYAALWEQRSGPAWQARHGLTASQYQQTFDQLVSQGYRLVQVSGCSVNGDTRYAALWEQRSGPAWQARHGLTASQYQQTFDQLVSQGYRLAQVSGYGVNGDTRYAALWEQRSGPAWQARHGLTASQYQQTFDQLVGQGYRLVQVSSD